MNEQVLLSVSKVLDPPKSPFLRGTLIPIPPFLRGVRGDQQVPKIHSQRLFKQPLILCVSVSIIVIVVMKESPAIYSESCL